MRISQRADQMSIEVRDHVLWLEIKVASLAEKLAEDPNDTVETQLDVLKYVAELSARLNIAQRDPSQKPSCSTPGSRDAASVAPSQPAVASASDQPAEADKPVVPTPCRGRSPELDELIASASASQAGLQPAVIMGPCRICLPLATPAAVPSRPALDSARAAPQRRLIWVRLADDHPAMRAGEGGLFVMYERGLGQHNQQQLADDLASVSTDSVIASCMEDGNVACALQLLQAGAGMTHRQYLTLHGAASILGEVAEDQAHKQAKVCACCSWSSP